eukprot:IDg14687t1
MLPRYSTMPQASPPPTNKAWIYPAILLRRPTEATRISLVLFAVVPNSEGRCTVKLLGMGKSDE